MDFKYSTFKPYKLYPKCILSGQIFSIENVIQKTQNICLEKLQHSNDIYLDEIHMYFAISVYNNLKIKPNININHCLNIIEKINDEDEEKLIIVTDICVLLTIIQDLYLDNLYLILKNAHERSFNKLQKLKICFTLVSVLEKKSIKDDNIPKLIMDLCSEMIPCYDSKMLRSLMITISQKLATALENSSFALQLWNNIKLKFDNDDNFSIHLEIMCCLSDLYLFSESTAFDLIINDLIYWNFLCRGIQSSENILRKQSMYLLKKTLDVFFTSEKKICVSNSLDSLFFWDDQNNADLQKDWLTYFVIMDSLDEKSSHIVMPALKLIYSLNNIPVLWINNLICKILNHETESIKRYGVIYALNFLSKNYKKDGDNLQNLILYTIVALNNTKLYNEKNVKHEDILPYLIEFFETIKEQFLIHAIDINWAPVPFFYVSYALTKCRLYEDLQIEPQVFFTLILELLKSGMKCPNVYIRLAIRNNIILFYTTNFVNLHHLECMADILITIFQEIDYVVRDSQLWTILMKFAKELHLQNSNICSILNDQLISKYPIKQIMLFILLVLDVDIIKHDDVLNFLIKILNYFLNCETRLYASTDSQIKAIDTIVTLLEVTKSSKTDKDDIPKAMIIKCISKYIKYIIKYIELKINSCKSLEDLDVLDRCLLLTKTILVNDKLIYGHENSINYLADACTQKLSSRCTSVEIYVHLALLATLVQNFYSCFKYDTIRCTKYIHKIYHSVLAHRNIPSKNSKNCDIIKNGKIASYYHKYFCNILYEYVKVTNTLADENTLGYLEDILDFGGNEIVLDAMKVLKYFLSYENDKSSAIKLLVARCWTESINLKKSDMFLMCMEAFIDMIIQPAVTVNKFLSEIGEEYSPKIIELGNSVPGLTNLLSRKVFLMSDFIDYYNFNEIIIKGLLFGSTSRRDQRIEHHTCCLIENIQFAEKVNHSLDFSVEVRAWSIVTVTKILSNSLDGKITDTNNKGTIFLHQLTDTLIQKSDVEDRSKIRYFSDSKHHRFKQRALQALLILQPFWDNEMNKKVLLWANDNLIKFIHQPSVRYLLEWLSARIIASNMDLISNLWLSMDQVVNIRIGAMTSFISIIYLLVQQFRDDQQDEKNDFINMSLTKIMPWTMGQHFNLRLYAQVVAKKLISSIKSMKSKSYIINESLTTILSYGNAVKFVKKVEEDVFLTNFDVIKHLSLDILFYFLPKLTNYTHEDLIHPDMFLKLCSSDLFEDQNIIPLYNITSSLDEAKISAWGIHVQNSDITVDNLEIGTDINIQQKITPWRSMDLVECNTMVEKAATKSSLIVVGSLINLAPNLGGLARTCEVFGVEEFAVDSLQIVKDKQFLNLSMTSEKWLNIVEVKQWQLSDYIINKKSEGYTVVGAEQTAKSNYLTNTTLPQKCVLVLGNEKEGIPANFLPLLDMCIEIPQIGLIRSLNVHVTGALFIWEYAKQYMLQ